MAIGSTNSSMTSKIEEDIKDLQTPTFSTAPSRSNINSGEFHTTILGKIKKYFTDLKTHAFNNPANNLTTTSSGSYALDAYQGKVLNDTKVDKSWKKLNGDGDQASTKYDTSTLAEGTELFLVVTALIDNEDIVFSKRCIINYDLINSPVGIASISIGACYNAALGISQACTFTIQNNKIWCRSIAINGVEHIADDTSRIYIFYR